MAKSNSSNLPKHRHIPKDGPIIIRDLANDLYRFWLDSECNVTLATRQNGDTYDSPVEVSIEDVPDEVINMLINHQL